MSVRFDEKRKRWIWDHYINGKKVLSYFKTERDAIAISRGILPIDVIPVVSCERVTIAQAINQYLKLEMPNKKPETQRIEKTFLKDIYDYLYDQCKIYYLDQVKQAHLEAFQNSLVKTTGHGGTVRRFHTYRAFLNKCVAWEMIEKSPGKYMRRLSEVSESERETWDAEDIINLSEHIPQWGKDIIYFMYLTGFRPGQACSLKWSDVDFDKQTIATITSKGKRVRRISMPIAHELVAFLAEKKEIARKFFRGRSDNHVFLNTRFDPVTPNALRLQVYRKRANIGKNVVAYGLRHTFGTELNDQGVPIQTIGRLMCHSRTSTTERYTRVEKNLQEVVASRRLNR